MQADPGVQIDIVGGLRRRAMLIGVIAGLVFLVTYWVAMAMPNQYDSYATLMIEPQQVTELAVRSGIGAGGGVNDRLHLMTATLLSRPRLSRVIDQLGLFEDESKRYTREKIIDLMREKVSVTPVLPELEAGMRLNQRSIEINTFRISFQSESPTVAAAVAQRLANDFIEEHISQRVSLTQKSLDFISTEQTRIAEVIRQLDREVAAIKEKNPGLLPEDLAGNQRALERTLDRMRNAERELDTARSDASFYQGQSLEAATITGGNDDVSPARRLALLELGLSNMRASGLTEKHPDVIRQKSEIETLRVQIAEAPDLAAAGDQPLSLAQRQAMAERKRAALRVANAEQEIGRLRREADSLRAKLDKAPVVIAQLETLQLRRRELADNLRDYNSRQLEANTRANLERKQLGEQFRIIEPAFPPFEPTSPNRVVILIIGLVMGLSLGVAAAVVAEASDSSVHGSSDLQNSLGVPVLASIPSIMLEADRSRQRKRRRRVFAAAIAVVVLSLLGGLVTYRVVNSPPGAETGAESAAAEPRLLGVGRG